MTGSDHLDELIGRLDGAAEQLRSGELSQDAAAGLVEDCAAIAGEAAAQLQQLERANASTSSIESPPARDSL